jgi:hypothetical protein
MPLEVKDDKEKGKRISVWIPERYYWIFDMLRKEVEEKEKKGVMANQSDVIREILILNLKPPK